MFILNKIILRFIIERQIFKFYFIGKCDPTLERALMASVGDFELITYSSRGEIVLSNGVSFILVRYSIKELQVETRGTRNVASFEI